jgi:hypothetical protein
MKKIFALVFSLLLFTTLTNCKKEKPQSPGTPPTSPGTSSGIDTSGNKKFNTSRDVSFATWLATDIESIISYPLENDLTKGHFLPQSGSSNTVQIIVDSLAGFMAISFNNVKCKDGKLRKGTIIATFLSPKRFSHDSGFKVDIHLVGYSVDGYDIMNDYSKGNLILKNTLTSSNFNPITTKLTWELTGGISVDYPQRHVSWNGPLVKTLQNATDQTVMPSSTSNINWDKAKVQYTGTVTGSTYDYKPFTYTIDNLVPIIKDYQCTPILTDNLITQFHPFIDGKVIFLSDNDSLAKTIVYGPQSTCDNYGNIFYKGTYYGVSFY